MDEIYLSRAGYEKLVKELEYLKSVKRKELSAAIEEARLKGDLRENAEYDAAKEASGHNERRIHELEQTLSRARLLEQQDLESDKVLIGCGVRLKDLDTEEELEYFLVSEQEADYDHNKISVTSPVGKGLLRHMVGDEVEITIPAGKLHYKVLEIRRV